MGRRAASPSLRPALWLSALFGMVWAVTPPTAVAQQDTAAAIQDTTPARQDTVSPGRDTLAQDTARITYRTEEIVFIAAGRAAGILVGDTLELLGADWQVTGRAVVVSVARRSSSAELVPPVGSASVGQLVRFRVHVTPPELVAVVAVPDTGVAVPAPDAQAQSSDTAPRPEPRPFRRAVGARWRANVQLDQTANSSGGAQALTSYQTSAGLALTAPIVSWLTFTTRSTTRWRNSSGNLSGIGLRGSSTIVYQLEARLAPPDSWWNLSLGRFVPADAPGLGYLDGARLEVRPSQAHRLGVVAGYAPDVFTMSPSTQVARAGAYWGFTTPSFSGSLSGATEWQFSQIRRTWLSAQSFWIPARGVSLSLLTDVDDGAGWQSFRGMHLTNLSAGIRTPLPLGFHAGLTVESHQALRLYSMFLAGDTMPLPGRLNGVTASLGRDVLGSSVEASAGYLKRATDATPTYRGTFTLFSRHFMVVAMGQHGDLFDFGSLLVRLPLPMGSVPFSAALSLSSNVTITPGGAQTLWRYDLRPEFGYRLGRGLYVSVSADFGRYAGRTSTYLRGGVSYQLW